MFSKWRKIGCEKTTTAPLAGSVQQRKTKSEELTSQGRERYERGPHHFQNGNLKLATHRMYIREM